MELSALHGKALQRNTSLCILDISGNRLSDEGVLAFVKYLKESHTLHQLTISWNDVHLDLEYNVSSLS